MSDTGDLIYNPSFFKLFLGTPVFAKMDEFPEKSEGGRGSFPVQKKLLQILCIKNKKFWSCIFLEKFATKDTETRAGG